MATPAANQATSVEENARNPTDIPRALAGQIHLIQSPPLLSTPLEMSRFEEHAPANDTPLVSSSPPTVISSDMDRSTREGQTQNTNFSTSASNSESQVQNPVGNTSTSPPASPKLSSPHPLTREKAIPAIGPSSDKPTLVPKESEINGPILMITLLLTNGARHPYKIDEKYLKKRSVNVEGNNPINMSTYTLKELIWREWREEWEARPSSPSSIRLIYYGKLLDDKMRLQDCKFVIGPTTHVVHMTIKPQEIVDEEDAKIAKSGTRDRDGNEGSPRCRCVIL